MPLLTTVAVVASATGSLVLVGPRLTAMFISRVVRHLLRDDPLRNAVGMTARNSARIAEQDLSKMLWSVPNQVAFKLAVIESMQKPEFLDAVVSVVQGCAQHHSLQETIREGVLEAFKDETMKAGFKALVIETMWDKEIRVEMLRSSISTIKLGIREAVEDVELKEVLSDVIRSSLEDPRLKGMLRTALSSALADQELHRATIQGAVSALNPFKDLKVDEIPGLRQRLEEIPAFVKWAQPILQQRESTPDAASSSSHGLTQGWTTPMWQTTGSGVLRSSSQDKSVSSQCASRTSPEPRPQSAREAGERLEVAQEPSSHALRGGSSSLPDNGFIGRAQRSRLSEPGRSSSWKPQSRPQPAYGDRTFCDGHPEVMSDGSFSS